MAKSLPALNNTESIIFGSRYRLTGKLPFCLQHGVNVMSLASNAILNIYSITILLVIYFHAMKFFEKNSLSDRLYMLILYVTVLLLGIDILSRFDGSASVVYRVLNHAGNFLMFVMSPVLPMLWVSYVHFKVYQDERRTRKLFYPFCIVFVINTLAVILSQFYGWLYYIGSDNIYHRGPFFLVPAFAIIMLMLAAFAITVANRGRLERRSFFSIVFVPVVPFICIILQVVFYGMSLVLNGVVISLLVVFINIQNHSLYTDYLTGLDNRKKLDAYLKEKVGLYGEEKGLCAVLIDINNFKQINDTYGHDMGDIALENAAKLIKNCVRSSDLVARFGGDEFCIIMEKSSESDLEALVCRINNCLEEYNRSGFHPYELKFSMGYAVYDHRSHNSAADFLKQIDMLMYQDKKACKNRIPNT